MYQFPGQCSSRIQKSSLHFANLPLSLSLRSSAKQQTNSQTQATSTMSPPLACTTGRPRLLRESPARGLLFIVPAGRSSCDVSPGNLLAGLTRLRHNSAGHLRLRSAGRRPCMKAGSTTMSLHLSPPSSQIYFSGRGGRPPPRPLANE